MTAICWIFREPEIITPWLYLRETLRLRKLRDKWSKNFLIWNSFVAQRVVQRDARWFATRLITENNLKKRESVEAGGGIREVEIKNCNSPHSDEKIFFNFLLYRRFIRVQKRHSSGEGEVWKERGWEKFQTILRCIWHQFLQFVKRFLWSLAVVFLKRALQLTRRRRDYSK